MSTHQTDDIRMTLIYSFHHILVQIRFWFLFDSFVVAFFILLFRKMAESIEKPIEVSEEENAPVDMIKLQQEFYEMFGHKSSVIYDCYTSKMPLEVKIDLIMPGLTEMKRTQLVDLIWSQRKFMGNKQLFMSPIFVCCIHDYNIKDHLKYPLDIKSKRFSIHPVYRVQKCLGTSTDENGQTKCCAIFVDEFARAYVNWKDFREKNKYEDGLVIAPRSGIYNGSSKDQVLLDLFVRRSGLTKNLDTGSTVVGKLN